MNKQAIFYWNIIFSTILIATTSMDYAMEEGMQQEIFPGLKLPRDRDIILYIGLPKTNKYKDIKSQLPVICKLRQLNQKLRKLFDVKFTEYKALLDQANRYDDAEKTPLLRAIENNDINQVKYLINNGADVNKVDKIYFNTTPLSRSVFCNNIAMVRILLENGANIYTNNHKLNALPRAARSESLDIAELLIQYDADVNQQNYCHNTLLHIAVMNDNLELAKFLIKHNADKTLTNNEGKTAYDLINDPANNPEMLALLGDKTAQS